jgi:hypothetical protein
MKRLFALLLLLIAVSWCVPESFAQRKRSRQARPGRYIIKDGKRIWVPQGSPVKTPQRNNVPTRRVFEREQEGLDLKSKTPKNRPTP